MRNANTKSKMAINILAIKIETSLSPVHNGQKAKYFILFFKKLYLILIILKVLLQSCQKLYVTIYDDFVLYLNIFRTIISMNNTLFLSLNMVSEPAFHPQLQLVSPFQISPSEGNLSSQPDPPSGSPLEVEEITLPSSYFLVDLLLICSKPPSCDILYAFSFWFSNSA